MRTCTFAIFLLASCGSGYSQNSDTTTTPCHNITQEFTVGVPFSWDVMEEEETHNIPGGCTITTTTHYVLDDSGGGGGGGSAADPRHCDADGCGGPLSQRTVISNPGENIGVERHIIADGLSPLN